LFPNMSNGKRVLAFALGQMEEHVGVVESEKDTFFILSNVITLIKEPQKNGELSISNIPFNFNVVGLKTVTINKNHLQWYSEDFDEGFKQKYLAALSGIVIPEAKNIQDIKDKVIQFPGTR